MYTVKVIQAPEVVYDDYDENFCKELESIVLINGDTAINGLEISINIEGTDEGNFISFKDKNNSEIKLKDSSYLFPFIEIEQDINDILEKLAQATFYEQLGKEGDEYTSEEILSWNF
jgi:hypothetical protein